jgi:hypothetical protein
LDDDSAEIFEAPPPVIVAAAKPESASPVPAASAVITPTPEYPAPLELVPLSEISRPQLRIASDAIPATQRAVRYDSLTVTDALSEDEVIALFG